MAQLLHIDASPRRERSHSRGLTHEFTSHWLAAHPESRVTHRDLGTQPVPLVDEGWIAAAFTPLEGRTPEMHEALRTSDALIDELLSADTLVFGVPMYNFGVSASFKAYIDQIVRVGRTFSLPNFEGLVKDKRAIIVMAAGQNYGPDTPMATMDYVTPYLRTVFGFIGITDVTFIAVVSNAGDEELARSLQSAREAVYSSARSGSREENLSPNH